MTKIRAIIVKCKDIKLIEIVKIYDSLDLPTVIIMAGMADSKNNSFDIYVFK